MLRRRRAVVAVSLVVLVAASVFTGLTFRVNTSTSNMLSPDLPFRQIENQIDDAFPELGRTIQIVIEAETPDQAQSAGVSMVEALRGRPEMFSDAFYFLDMSYFRDNGFLFSDLDQLNDAALRLADMQPLLTSLWTDMSLRGLFDVLRLALEHREGDEAIAVTPALDQMSDVIEANTGGDNRQLSWFEVMSDDPLEADDFVSTVTAYVQPDYRSLDNGGAEIAAVHEVAGELGLVEDNGYRVRVTGSLALSYDELQTISVSLPLISLLSLGLVVGILLLGMRAGRLLVATVITLLVGLATTFAFAMAAYGQLNIISVAFGVLFIGLSIDFGIHVILRFQEHQSTGDGIKEALTKTYRGIAKPLALCAVSTAIGFYSFFPTAFRGVSELGGIAGTGMIIALITNLTLLPVLIYLFRPKPRAKGFTGGRGVLAGAIQRYHKPVLAAAVGLAIGAAILAPSATMEHDPLALKNQDTESVETLRFLVDIGRSGRYSVRSLAPDLASAEALAERLETLPGVDRANSPANLVPSRQEEKLAVIDDMSLYMAPLLAEPPANDPPTAAELESEIASMIPVLKGAEGDDDFSRGVRRLGQALGGVPLTAQSVTDLQHALLVNLPARLQIIRSSLLAKELTMEDVPPILRDQQIAPDGRALVFAYPPDGELTLEQQEAFLETVRQILPDAGGSLVSMVEAGNAVMNAFVEAGIYAFIAITLLLLVVLRSVRDTLLVMGPLILAGLLTVAGMVVVGLSFNFANVIVLPLILGIGVDSGIHIVTRAREEQAANRTLFGTSTPRAIVLSSLTTLASFGALSLSSHTGSATMGQLLTISIVMVLFSMLVVLPAMMALLDRGRQKSGGRLRAAESLAE